MRAQAGGSRCERRPLTKTLVRDETIPEAPSVDPAEIEKFRKMAADWWSPTGKFAPLHKFNPARLTYIRETAVTHFGLDAAAKRPLEGLRLLDAGCGGGLVTEPMARLGAHAVGLDAGDANIKAAMVHADSVHVDVDYRVGTVEGLIAANEPKFDIVLALEVVEHVQDAAQFLKDCASLAGAGRHDGDGDAEPDGEGVCAGGGGRRAHPALAAGGDA